MSQEELRIQLQEAHRTYEQVTKRALLERNAIKIRLINSYTSLWDFFDLQVTVFYKQFKKPTYYPYNNNFKSISKYFCYKWVKAQLKVHPYERTRYLIFDKPTTLYMFHTKHWLKGHKQKNKQYFHCHFYDKKKICIENLNDFLVQSSQYDVQTYEGTYRMSFSPKKFQAFVENITNLYGDVIGLIAQYLGLDTVTNVETLYQMM